MANQSFYSSYDARRDSSTQAKNILRQLPIYIYDIVKFFAHFVGEMFKMVMGR